MFMEKMYLGKVSGIGNGVFAKNKIYKGEVFATTNVVVYTEPLHSSLKISDYEFSWEDNLAIAFGDISFLNHSSSPNVELVRDFEKKTISLRALENILADEELRFCYGTVWFDVEE
jgi:hypothetical protein